MTYVIPTIISLPLLQQQLNGPYAAQFQAASASSLALTDPSTTNATSTVKIVDNAGAPYEQWLAGSAIVHRYYDAPDHVFRSASGTEWARLTSARLILGAATSPNSARLSVANVGSGISNGFEIVSSNTTGFSGALFVNPNGNIGSIGMAGSATSFNTSSDETLKVRNGYLSAETAIQIIRADPSWDFTWKATGEQAYGWGAQTSYKVRQDLAAPGGWFDENLQPCEADAEGARYQPWGLDQSKRTPYLWAALGASGGVLDRLDTLEATLVAARADFDAYKAAHP